jgi:ABC-type amino acid transport substrate-binding protein
VQVGVSAVPKWPYWYPVAEDGSVQQPSDAAGNLSDPSAANWTGFLRPILDSVCEAAALDCELVFYSELTDRIPLLQNGSVDFILDTLSATDERAQLVDFVYPGFYSAGVSLYTTPEQAAILEGAGGWDGLTNLTVCMPEGYYATEALQRQYGINVIETKIEEAVAAVKGDDFSCTALAYDSGQPRLAKLGLPEASSIPPVLTTRYAIPVRKGNDALRRRLSAALVELMQAGTRSPIQEWEKDYLLDNGVPPNPELEAVVQAISYFQ